MHIVIRCLTAFYLIIVSGSYLLYAACHKSYSTTGTPKYESSFANFSYVNLDTYSNQTLKLYHVGRFTTFNPYGAIGLAPKDYFILTQDTLMISALDDVNSFYPLLASKVCFGEQKLSVEFHLNPKALWHNGAPITAHDVAFTINILKTSSIVFYRALFASIKEVQIQDENTLTVHFYKYSNELFTALVTVPIISLSYWKERDFVAPSLEIPQLSGAYTIEAFNDNEIIFSKVEDYWGQDLPTRKGHFNVGKIKYLYLDSDSNIDYLLVSGVISFKREDDYYKLNNFYTPKMLSDHGLKKIGLDIKDRIPRYFALFFNLRHDKLQDIRVRQALYLAYDFDKVNLGILNNSYLRLTSLFPKSPFDYHYSKEQSVEMLNEESSFDLNRSAQLLALAGFKMIDGRLFDTHNKPFVLNMIFKNKDTISANLSFINNLKRLGIFVNYKVLGAHKFYQVLNNREFDMIEANYLFAYPPSYEITSYFSCEHATQVGSLNFSGICDETLDLLISQLLHVTKSERLELTRQIDHSVASLILSIPLYYKPKEYYIYNDGIRLNKKPNVVGFDITTMSVH